MLLSIQHSYCFTQHYSKRSFSLLANLTNCCNYICLNLASLLATLSTGLQTRNSLMLEWLLANLPNCFKYIRVGFALASLLATLTCTLHNSRTSASFLTNQATVLHNTIAYSNSLMLIRLLAILATRFHFIRVAIILASLLATLTSS